MNCSNLWVSVGGRDPSVSGYSAWFSAALLANPDSRAAFFWGPIVWMGESRQTWGRPYFFPLSVRVEHVELVKEVGLQLFPLLTPPTHTHTYTSVLAVVLNLTENM